MAGPHWADRPDGTFRVRAEFGDGKTSYTTLEHAADALDFIDRDKGLRDLIAGMTFRSHLGTMFTDEGGGISVTAEPGSLAGRLLGL